MKTNDFWCIEWTNAIVLSWYCRLKLTASYWKRFTKKSETPKFSTLPAGGIHKPCDCQNNPRAKIIEFQTRPFETLTGIHRNRSERNFEMTSAEQTSKSPNPAWQSHKIKRKHWLTRSVVHLVPRVKSFQSHYFAELPISTFFPGRPFTARITQKFLSIVIF